MSGNKWILEVYLVGKPVKIIRSSLWNLKTFLSFELHSRISLITSTSSKCQPALLPRIGSPSSI